MEEEKVEVWEKLRDGLHRYSLCSTWKTNDDGSEYSATTMEPADFGMWVSTVSVFKAIKAALALGEKDRERLLARIKELEREKGINL